MATPDFSPFGDMPMACQIYNHYRKHWVGAYLQANGITVIPTVRGSSDPRFLECCFDGEPHDGIILISSMWQNQDENYTKLDNEFKDKMLETLNPRKILVYGKEDAYLKEHYQGKMETIKSFTQKRWEDGD